jgi:Quinohemoprotein amine dehydrogenase, alpha subunit domain III
MSYNCRIVFATVLFALLGVAEAVSAKESYKDEAGRVLYMIDDDGIVSMFENSPTDLTLSVTRGTREQMKPQVIEITPETIPAGTSTVLRLKGKNLIGATVKFSAPGIEVSAYVAKPKALDLSIHVPATVPPGDVTLEVTTPIGRTEAVFKVKELQIGGIGSARRESGTSQKLTTAAPTSCPSGMVGVSADRGGFCIEIDRTFSGDFRQAEKACAAGGKRLCQVPEWQRACEQAKSGRLPIKNMIGDWEWTATLDRLQIGLSLEAIEDIRNILLGEADCQAKRIVPGWKSEVYSGRCCK